MRRLLLLVTLVCLVSGCESLSYYGQSINGHLSLMSSRVDIDAVLGDPATDDALRKKLQLVQKVREFASTELGLPRNDSYTEYVDVGSPYVVWNVVATPEFSLSPQQWCFLVVGCLSYRGYYDRADAADFAAELRSEGLDVFVGGSRAYSTLGWFDDPLLNTMLDQSEAELAAVIFHELAHQQVYINDDTAFNESFAVAVEHVGVRRWFEHQQRAAELADFRTQVERDRRFTDLLLEARAALGDLYAQQLEERVMREKKQDLVVEFRQRYEASDLGDAYAGWFRGELNNAKLALVATYWHWVPAFLTLFDDSGSSFPAFYDTVRELGELPVAERHARLNAD